MKFIKQELIYYFLFLAVNIFFFSTVLKASGVLYFNDFALPPTLDVLKSYLHNLSIYNLDTNLGLVRLNFFNELAPLASIRFISFFVSYVLAIKLFLVLGFWLIQVSFFKLFQRISQNNLTSFAIGLLTTYNLWSFDRLQQGHYFNLIFFLSLLPLFIYYLFYSFNGNKYIILGIILFFSLFVYYHYTFILIYILIIDFFSQLLLHKDYKKLIQGYFILTLVLILLSSVFWLSYLSSAQTFKSLSDKVSSQESIKLFSWQSTPLSTFFHIRTGMASHDLVSGFTILFTIAMVGLLYFVWLKKGPNNISSRLYIVILILFFLSFGFWINEKLFSDFIYRIPTMAAFRDMNKFTGIGFILSLSVLAGNLKDDKRILRYIFLVMVVLLLLPFTKPYRLFVTLDPQEVFIPRDSSLYAVIAFPSYPIVYFTENNWPYHKYLPAVNSYNNFRNVFLPYDYQQDQTDFAKADFFKKLYQGWDSLTEGQIYERLSQFGIKYIYYYRNYDFVSNDPAIDSWYRKLDIIDKLSQRHIIFGNDKLIVYKLPDKYFRPIITTTTGASDKFQKVNDAEFRIFLTTKIRTDLKTTINYNPNWHLYLQGGKPVFEDSHKVINGYANDWQIQPGNYDFILYFKPQTYFKIGFAISVLSFLGCIGYMLASKKYAYLL